MISSMTGYGKAIAERNNLIAEVEIKALNSKFLDLFVKIPKSQSDKEIEIRELVRKKIKRGKVSLNVFIKREGCGDKYVDVDDEGLKVTLDIIEKIKKGCNIEGDISFEQVSQFQNLYLTDEFEDSELEYQLIIEALKKALDKLIEMRKVEGNELKTDLNNRIDLILENVQNIDKIKEGTIEDYFNKIKEKAKHLLDEFDQYDERLKVELALIAEKYDITEEIVRLKSHLKMFKEMLENDAEVGRKLNFLSQEINREANTINSKSVSTDISYLALNIKEELEKIKEQIQNIE